MSDNIGGGGGGGGGGSGSGKYPLFQLLVSEAIAGGVTLFVLWMTSRWVGKIMNPFFDEQNKAKAMHQAVVDRLLKGGIDPERLEGLTQWEVTVAQELVFPEDIEGGMEELGGLETAKQLLHDDIVIPLERPDIFSANPLLNPPRGILLYGPPGTGKTSLAKALAKQRGINFICISPSSLLSKWVGDTQQLTRAIFSLANRIEPCLIFLDEIDALFRERSIGDHEVYRDMKAEFMQLWDGLFSTSLTRVIVLGCTNRPWDVDPAIQRRLPRSIKVGLPDLAERVKIVKTVLKTTRLDPAIDFNLIASKTEGFSGSDLKELCRCALMGPMKEKVVQDRKSSSEGKSSVLRPLKTEDILGALTTVQPTTVQSTEYRNELMQQRSSDGGGYTNNFGSDQVFREDLRDILLGAIAQTQESNSNVGRGLALD